MPGIAGVIGARLDAGSVARLQPMLECMLHEKFYTSGSYANERLGVWVGWCHHPGSFSDCAPVWNEARDIVLIFSGEDFAPPGEIEALRRRGHVCEPQNASYLVHHYEEMGLGFLGRINGWFSGVLVDLREKKVVLFGDRYGLHRIYYHETPEGLFFSSEAKSILKMVPRCRAIEEPSLAEWISCGCVLQNRTLFSGISLLPGGSAWSFSADGKAKKGAYFRRETWEGQPALTGADYYEKLKETFSRILPHYFGRRGGTGMSLTGGLDGRMIMAWANAGAGTVPCYTFGGSYRDCRDVRIARAVSKACGQPHRVIPVDGAFLRQFADHAAKAVYVSDGAMDVTGAVELYVNRAAREIAPVRMTGNYGSEILRGHVAFRPRGVDAEAHGAQWAALGGEAAETYAREAQCHPVSFIAFKQVPWHHRSRLSVEQSQIILRAPYLDNELVALMYRAPREAVTSSEPSLRLIAEGSPALGRIPTDRGLVYRGGRVAGQARRAYQEFTVRAEYAYDYGMPQWLARVDHSVSGLHLEKLFLGRHKFCHFRVWYRDQLAGFAKEVLLDGRARGRPYWRSGYLEEMVKSHTEGRRNHTLDIHRALTMEFVHRTLLEN